MPNVLFALHNALARASEVHCKHSDASVILAYVPAGQAKQVVAAIIEKVPAEHNSQLSMLFAPMPVENVPAGQKWHCDCPVRLL